MGSDTTQPTELDTLASLAGRAEADPEEILRCLDSLLNFCQNSSTELSECAAQSALRALSATARSAIRKKLHIRPEVLSVLIDFLSKWQSESIFRENVEVLEETWRFLHAQSHLPVEFSLSRFSLVLARMQDKLSDFCLRAAVFCSLFRLLVSDYPKYDMDLRQVLEITLSALNEAESCPSQATRFSLQVHAVCCLSCMHEAFAAKPVTAKDYSATIMKAAVFVIQRIQGEDRQLHDTENAAPEHSSPLVEEHHVLTFFGSLPNLMTAFCRNGLATTDSLGNTVLHRLAGSSLTSCLEIFLHSCGTDLDPFIRNLAGLTAIEVAAAAGHDASVDLISRYIGNKSTSATSICTKPQDLKSKASGGPLLAHDPLQEAIARAASMPMPHQQQAGGVACSAPSLSWTGPEGGTQHPASQEERIKLLEAMGGPIKEHQKLKSTSSRASSEAAEQPGLPSEGSASSFQPKHQPNDFDLHQRKRIVELALAKLSTASEGRAPELDKSQAPEAVACFQNPAGTLPTYNNPFAAFQQQQLALEGDKSLKVDPAGFNIPSVLRTGSMGCLGLEGSSGTSPTQGNPGLRHHSLSYDSRGMRTVEQEDQSKSLRRSGEWENSTTPSTRMWLGNIAAHVTVRSLHEVFGSFGQLTDAAVFPARIGPLGYAFVNFLNVEDAARAYEALNNTSVPTVTGSKLLKIRYKPAQPSKGTGEGLENIVPKPSNHLWLGNIPTRPNKFAIEDLFGQFGLVTSVRVFPGKTYAFVNYDSVTDASTAMQHLDGRIWPLVSGNKPMVVRYQSMSPQAPPLLDPVTLRNLNVPPVLLGGTLPLPSTNSLGSSLGSNLLTQSSLGALDPAVSSMQHASLPVLAGLAFSIAPAHQEPGAHGPQQSLPQPLVQPGQDPESLLPAINLSNRLNPNNMHYDRDLADLYKNMSKAEKEALWADDRSQQHLLAMQGQDQLPTDLSILGLPAQQASLLANHLAGQNNLDLWGGSCQAVGSAPQTLWGGGMSSQLPSFPLQIPQAQQALDIPVGKLGRTSNQVNAVASNLFQVPPLNLPPSAASLQAQALAALSLTCQSLTDTNGV